MMDVTGVIQKAIGEARANSVRITTPYPDEMYVGCVREDFRAVCQGLHKACGSPVMSFFAVDERATRGVYRIMCVFLSREDRRWILAGTDVDGTEPRFGTLAKDIYSASLFEREMKEMFGIIPDGNPDQRRLRLHDEVWPNGQYPLRKDFRAPGPGVRAAGAYSFKRLDGEGIFEVPVGPVHAGIIGPGHFRFSVAGEPIANLELRLGFTHRGVEKLFEGKSISDAVRLAECVSGDAAFAHSLAFCTAAEKICGIVAPKRAAYVRAICLELERLYNHSADMGGMALDVGFSFPAAYASLIKEAILALNGRLTGHRYLKGVNVVGGVMKDLRADAILDLTTTLDTVLRDFAELESGLMSSISFLDRADETGILKRKTAEDIGVVGPAARACGIPTDLRKDLRGIYDDLMFSPATETAGDVLARLKVRCAEVGSSLEIIRQCLDALSREQSGLVAEAHARQGAALGCAEAWRGGVLTYLAIDDAGLITRCEIVDPSFQNWQALSFAVLGNIIPDFPLCNKSFDLSYAGNDL